MTDFSDDEVFALLACAICSAVAGFRYYLPIFSVTLLAGGARLRLLLALVPPLCIALLLPVLLHLTSHEVLEDHGYVVLFALGGGVWLTIATAVAELLGISARDDAIERRNPAAAVALCGAMLGLTCAYAGANVGEGATIWMTFGPAVLATIVWVAAWGTFQLLTGASDTIAIDREVSSALRLAGLFVALGLVLGRAVAGDYESAERTLHDLVAQGWPVLPLTLAAAVVQIRARPRPGRLHAPASRALLAAGIYLAISALWILLLGKPRIGGAR